MVSVPIDETMLVFLKHVSAVLSASDSEDSRQVAEGFRGWVKNIELMAEITKDKEDLLMAFQSLREIAKEFD